ncbi:TonB-dependent receptor [Chitinophaga ginsengisegetis]|uniref:TonB-dependent receptor n=1 Tax=Chitinophaga ginsengisegetis TaxID=393003 RepID=UPI000DBF8DDB|nr:TonB-dependent receptor [Chitinophaga ginsengisegetis]MDR6566944.1 TonB-linked SusC/RagA family outer membrane protein [Chitinophaga ginsengisegetis]MDR6646674.1 TonB-linked SusC/RagA family outer membrane protein [Chitinophaga ginsengisegetis]MDR6653024.1 TonB-linked SusC/RagA family outer membrane protein [Chitinophaga ginsengisegetis]
MLKLVFLEWKGKPVPTGKLLLTMKLTVLLFLTCLQVQAICFAQETITLQVKETSIKQLLKTLEHQTAYRFVFHDKTLPENKKVTVAAKEATLDAVLSQAFAGTNLAYSLKEDGLVVVYAGTESKSAVDITIRGTVRGLDNLPLPGVTVRASGTTAGTLTNEDGAYTLIAPDNATTLQFSLVGYVSQQVTIGNRREINVVLTEDIKTLNAVTVTGYTNYARDKSTAAAGVVGADKITQVPMATFDQILQGRVPGMVVSAGSGQPGTSATITVRGVGTINGSSSVLYVMDGIPIEAGQFQGINPSDIASVTVLKDASAKALYGSRGSNGVIVITTKKGQAGRLAVSYKSQYGFSNMTTPKFQMMNSAQHLQFEEEIGLETGANLGPGWEFSSKNPDYANKTPQEKQEADHIIDSLRNVNTDWRKIFLQTGKFQEQQLSVSGGNENIRFYSSVNYYDQQGIAKRSELKRYSFKNNLDFNAGKLTANINVGLAYSESSFIEREASSSGSNPLAAVYYALPYEYPYAPDGTLVTNYNDDVYPVYDLREGSNALEALLNTSSKDNQLKSIIGTSLNYILAKGLVAKTRLGIDFRETTTERYVNPDSYSGYKVDNGGRGSFGEGVTRNVTLVSTSGLTYSKVAGKHDFEVSGYFEFTRNNYRAFDYTGYDLDDRLPATPAAITPGSPYNALLGGGRTKSALASWIGVGRYTFNEKYTLNASYRYDGASTVPPDNRWHGFYSLGVGWEVKKENFLKDVSFVDNLRFRASYGTSANPFSNLGPFAYFRTYGTEQYGGNPAIVPNQPGNPNYDWEYAKEFNVGFDLGVMNNRIRLVTDVYNKVTNNLFIEQPLSITSGFSTMFLNSGAMRNRGIEMDLQGDIVKRRDFTWSVGVNFAYNKNVITDLGASGEFTQGTTQIVRVGLPYGSHYAPKWAGVDPQTGDPLYYDRSGNKTSDYNETALSVAEFGTYIPPFTGGFNTGVTWKGFYLNALFTFADKTMRYLNEDYYNENPSFASSNQSVRMLYDRWKKPGDNAILPKFDASRGFSSKDIQDASYLRLRNVNIGYNFPKEIMTHLKFVQGIQIFAQAQNLYTWTKWKSFDPENNYGEGRFDYPSARTYTFGLNVNF